MLWVNFPNLKEKVYFTYISFYVPLYNIKLKNFTTTNV